MVEVEGGTGVIGLWDPSVYEPSMSGKDRDFVPDLRESARQGDLFFIDAEDPVTYRIEVATEGGIPGDLAAEFEARGGGFRLRAPSGRVLNPS